MRRVPNRVFGIRDSKEIWDRDSGLDCDVMIGIGDWPIKTFGMSG